MRRWTSIAALAATATTGIVLGTGGPALALPGDCTSAASNVTRIATSFCATGTGEHRIFVLQKHFLAEVGYIPIYGDWAPVGATSTAQITPHTIVYFQVERR
jgi:hypothetical protein